MLRKFSTLALLATTIAFAAEDGTGAAPVETKAPKDIQNGITRPGEGTATRRVWDIADGISAQEQRPALREEVMNAGLAEGLNKGTIATQYAKWTTYYGVPAADRSAARKALNEAANSEANAEKEAAKAEKQRLAEAAKAEKAAARQAEKERKENERKAASLAKAEAKAAAVAEAEAAKAAAAAELAAAQNQE